MSDESAVAEEPSGWRCGMGHWREPGKPCPECAALAAAEASRYYGHPLVDDAAKPLA